MQPVKNLYEIYLNLGNTIKAQFVCTENGEIALDYIKLRKNKKEYGEMLEKLSFVEKSERPEGFLFGDTLISNFEVFSDLHMQEFTENLKTKGGKWEKRVLVRVFKKYGQIPISQKQVLIQNKKVALMRIFNTQKGIFQKIVIDKYNKQIGSPNTLYEYITGCKLGQTITEFETEEKLLQKAKATITVSKNEKINEKTSQEILKFLKEKGYKTNEAIVTKLPFANNLYEVDLNGKKLEKFLNPELACTRKGEIIINYGRVFSKKEEYKKTLSSAGITEKRDMNGKYFFERNGKKIFLFEGFAILNMVNNLEGSPEERDLLIKLFKLKNQTPVSIEKTLRTDKGAIILKVFNNKKGVFQKVLIDTSELGREPENFYEYTAGLRLQEPSHYDAVLIGYKAD